MQVIYADSVFIVNTVINYLILLASAKVCGTTISRLRLLLGAATGGAYALAAAFPQCAFLKNPFVIGASGLLVVLCAFGGQQRIARIALVFFAVSSAFAGAVLAVSLIGGGTVSTVSIRALVLSFIVCYAVMTLVFRRTAGNRGAVVPLIVRQGKAELRLRALIDTGNSLTDPMTGMPVIITGVCEAAGLFPKEVRGTVEELESLGAVSVLEELTKTEAAVKFRLIPYSAVGVSGGMLLAFRPDEVIIGGTEKTGTLVALSPNSVSDNGTYSALIGA